MVTLREIHRDTLRPLLIDALMAKNLRVWVAGYLTVAGRRLDNKQKNIEILTLEDYLLDHTNLAADGLNFELLAGFADALQSICQDESLSLRVNYNGVAWLMEAWRFLLDEPLGQKNALVIVPCCSAVGTGIHAVSFRSVHEGTRLLMHISATPLKVVRQAVVFGFQRMLAEDWSHTMYELRRYAHIGDALQHRIAAAAVADPDLLADHVQVLDAFDLHHSILSAFRRLSPTQRRQEGALVLRHVLPKTISVLVAALPETGFAAVRTWLTWRDPDVDAILRETLAVPALREVDEAARLAQTI